MPSYYFSTLLYIIAGGYGQKSTLSSPNNFDIAVPEHIWKVIVVMDNPGQTIADINQNTIAFAIDLPNINPATDRDINGNLLNPNDWKDYIVSVRELEARLNQYEATSGLHYNFLSNISTKIQDDVENVDINVILNWINTNNSTAPLLADSALDAPNLNTTSINTTVGHDSFVANNILIPIQVFSPTQVGITEIGIEETSFSKISVSEDRSPEINLVKGHLSENSVTKVNSFHITIPKTTFVHADSSKFGKAQVTVSEPTAVKIGVGEVGFLVDSTLSGVIRPMGTDKISSSEVLFSPSILSNQFFPIHNSTSPFSTGTLNSNLNTSNPSNFNLNIKFQIADLPTGQLAEATITGYDTNNRPNSGTLTLDINGNGSGWFIDTTPDDNSEFTTQLADTAYKATADSAAYGKYDLLTTILHELGHLNGIIRGNTAFDTHVQKINGILTFIDAGITATLTPDGSHLDTTFHPYDLMNTSLKPGVRKLPSTLNLAMIDVINAGIGNRESGVAGIITAPLTAGALVAINNGDFSTTADWNTTGATNIINGTATFTEQSQKLSELTQAFIIPTGAKTLQFTITDNHLIPGDTTKTANDAFEVALLDTNTFTPLAGTSIGLNHTDSLLNIQANGTIHKSDKVTITPLGNNSSIVSIDLTQITPSTNATLYFNLLGFGARTSTVTIDDVKLFTDTQPIPVTKNDTLTTNQATPLTFDFAQVAANDTNVSQIQIINQPTAP